VLKQISKLVEAGAIVVGDKPETTPSLADDQYQFHTLTDKLWGSGSGGNVGQGNVYGGQNLENMLSTLSIAPDFEYSKPKPDTQVLFVHRKVADGDLYFIDNRNDRDESFDSTFRVSGRAAELWHPDTGLIEPVSYQSSNGRTTVPLHLEPWGTVFVVFRHARSAPSRTLPAVAEQPVATVEGSWGVSFQPDRGAPPKITLDKLASWTDSSDEGVKYFAGTATYTKTLKAPASWFKSGTRMWIDLGDVKNLAEVSVNGKSLGIVWKSPYRVDATGALKAGMNRLTIKVTIGWANRIIGDHQSETAKQYTLTLPTFYKASSPLWPSGLLGPVRLVQLEKALAK